MRVTERLKQVPLIESKDYGSAGIDSDSVNMGLLRSLAVLLTFGALTGNSVLKFYAGATAGAKTTALAFKYRLGSADYKAANADVLGAWIDVAPTGLTLTGTTFDHRLVAVEFDSANLPDGKPWLTVEIDATATVMNVGGLGVGDARYDNSFTVI